MPALLAWPSISRRPLGIACDADRGHAGFAGVAGLHRGTASGALVEPVHDPDVGLDVAPDPVADLERR